MTTQELSPRLCDSKAHGLSSWEKNRLEFETSQLFSQINPKHRNLTMGSRVGGQIVQTRVGQLWFCKGWTAHKAPLWRKPWMCGRSPKSLPNRKQNSTKSEASLYLPPDHSLPHLLPPPSLPLSDFFPGRATIPNWVLIILLLFSLNATAWVCQEIST